MAFELRKLTGCDVAVRVTSGILIPPLGAWYLGSGIFNAAKANAYWKTNTFVKKIERENYDEADALLTDEREHINVTQAICKIVKRNKLYMMRYISGKTDFFDMRTVRVSDDKTLPILIFTLEKKLYISFASVLQCNIPCDLTATHPDSNKTALQLIAEKDLDAECRLFLEICNTTEGVDTGTIINAREGDTEAAIITAARKLHHTVLEMLANHPGTDLTVRDAEERTLPLIATKKGGSQSFHILLRAYESRGILSQVIDNCDRENHSLVILLAQKRKLSEESSSMLSHLFTKQIDLICLDGEYGYNLLHIFCDVNNMTHFQELQRVREDVFMNIMNQEDRTGRTPLHLALELNRQEATHTLLRAGADITILTEALRTPFHFFAMRDDFDSCRLCGEHCSAQMTSELLNRLDGNMQTALYIAASKNNYRVVQFLLDNGADLTISCNGKTAYDVAPKRISFMARSSEIIRDRLNGRGLRPGESEEEINQEQTALHFCLTQGNYQQARAHIANGLSLDHIDQFGNDLYLQIIKSGMPETQKLELIKLVRSNGCPINVPNASGETLIIVVAQNGYGSIVEELVIRQQDEGRNVDLSYRDLGGDIPLHHACRNSHRRCVEALLTFGGSRLVNEQNETGQTPLHLTQNEAIANLLIKAGADSDITDSRGLAAYDSVVRQRRRDQVGKSMYSASKDLQLHERAQLMGNRELAMAARAHHKKGDITAEDVLPLHKQRSDSLSGFGRGVAAIAAQGGEKLVRTTVYETGESAMRISTKVIKSGEIMASAAITSVSAAASTADLVGSVATSALQAAKRKAIKKIEGKSVNS